MYYLLADPIHIYVLALQYSHPHPKVVSGVGRKIIQEKLEQKWGAPRFHCNFGQLQKQCASY